MKGSEFFKTLSDNVSTREDQILSAVVAGDIYWEWTLFEVEHKGHKVKVTCTSLPLAIGDACDNVMVNVTAKLAEDITNHFKFAPMTARLADRIHEAATMVLPAKTQPSTSAERVRRGFSPQMHDVAANVRSDQDIKRSVDAARKSKKSPALVDGPFKWWVATAQDRPERVANYGMYGGSERGTLSGIRVWNRVLYGHTMHHLDYSQFYRGVLDEFEVTYPDGRVETIDFETLAKHPVLYPVVSHEGPMNDTSLLPSSNKSTGQAPSNPQPPQRIGRNLRRGMWGEDVKAWQRTIGVKADGIFGSGTENATKGFQRAHGLVADGVVGPMTRAAARDNKKVPESDAWDDSVDIDNLPFRRAKNYNPTKRTDIRQIVIHSMEAAEHSQTAESVAHYFAGTYTTAPMASAHLNIDNDSVVMSVPLDEIAYHAKGGNRYGIGIEHAGYHYQSREDWLDDYGQSMLWLSAQCAAQICQRYNIPVRMLTEEQVRKDERGITTHAMITKAKKVWGGHGDPGDNFPFAEYLRLIRRAMQLSA